MSVYRRVLRRLTDRYPLRVRATWAALILGLGTFGIQVGLDGVLVQQAQHAATALLDLLVIVGFVKSSEGHVTPTADPRNDAGQQLTPGPIGTDDAAGLPPI